MAASGLAERQRDDGEGAARDGAHAGGEPVEPVEEVDHVHDGDDPDDGQRLAHPRRELVHADERERETVDPDAGGDRDRRSADLTGELLPPEEAAEVVDRADGRGDGRAEQEAAHLVREVDERERRDDDPEEEGEAAELGDDPLVDTPLARPVDDAEEARDVADDRRQQQDDDEREPGAVEDFPVRSQLVEHLLGPVQAIAGVAEARAR